MLSSVVFITCLTNSIFAASSPSQLLEILRARDAQLDNANIRYTESYAERMPAEVIRNLTDEDRKAMLDRKFLVQHQHLKQLTIRSFETSFTSEPDPSATLDNPQNIGFMKLERESNKTGPRWSYAEQIDGYKDITISAIDPQNDALLQSRMRIEFSLGLGYGSRLTAIDSIGELPGGIRIEGEITPYQMAPGHCTLVLDSNYVVRSARIVSTVEDETITIDVRSDGARPAGALTLATTAEFTRTQVNEALNSERPVPKVLEHFQFSLDDVEFDLSDEKYAALTSIEIPPGTRVRDIVGVLSGDDFLTAETQSESSLTLKVCAPPGLGPFSSWVQVNLTTDLLRVPIVGIVEP